VPQPPELVEEDDEDDDDADDDDDDDADDEDDEEDEEDEEDDDDDDEDDDEDDDDEDDDAVVTEVVEVDVEPEPPAELELADFELLDPVVELSAVEGPVGVESSVVPAAHPPTWAATTMEPRARAWTSAA
jgi:hypothetical protein